MSDISAWFKKARSGQFVTTEKIGPVHLGNFQRNDFAAGIFAERV